jgi:hypothetical protein
MMENIEVGIYVGIAILIVLIVGGKFIPSLKL